MAENKQTIKSATYVADVETKDGDGPKAAEDAKHLSAHQHFFKVSFQFGSK